MKPVIVKVKSVQRNEEGEELAIELVSEGKAYKKERTQYIVYEESELTDMEGVTTVIKVLPDGAVMLLRLGKVHQRQEYRKGKVSHSKYETPIGALNVTFRTTIHLGYDVDLEGVGSNYTQLTITVQEDNCNGNEGIIETGHC